jgi:hypothetical protein
MNTKQALEYAEMVWRENVTPLVSERKKIREEAIARAEAEIAVLNEERWETAARAIHFALDHGVTKLAVRRATTMDFHRFEEYVALGAQLAETESPTE